jgi:uncharacterized membrane protein YdjX (TVP38/TMEM64 family)
VSDWLISLARIFAHPGPWGAVVFVGAYVAASITLMPAVLLTFTAGAVWGLWKGTLLVYVAAVIASSVVYALATPLARWRVLAWMDRDPRIAVVRRAVVGEGFRIMFLLRLSPLLPFVFLNYALALGGVRYVDYLLASVGMLPAIVMYVYYGKVVGDVALLAAGVMPARSAGYYAMVGIGLVATVVATTLVTRAARRAIQEQEERTSPRQAVPHTGERAGSQPAPPR